MKTTKTAKKRILILLNVFVLAVSLAVIAFAGHQSNEERGITISFEPNNGTTISDAHIDAAYASFNVFYDLPAPIKAGHYFNGWFTSASGGTEIDAVMRSREDGNDADSFYGVIFTETEIINTIKIENNVTLYAHWTPISERDFLTTKCYFAEVLSNKSETLAIAHSDVGWFYTENGLNYKQLDFSDYLPDGSNETTEDIYVAGDTFVVCVNTFHTEIEAQDIKDDDGNVIWRTYEKQQALTSHVLLTSTDLKHFERHTMPEDNYIGDVLQLDNGTYVIQPGYYSKNYWQLRQEDQFYDKSYYYTTLDFATYQKHELPSTGFKAVTYEAFGNYLVLSFRQDDAQSYGDAEHTQIDQQTLETGAIYVTKDFNHYTNVTPAANGKMHDVVYFGDSKYGNKLIMFSTQINEWTENGENCYKYLLKLSKTDLNTGEETILRSNSFIWSWTMGDAISWNVLYFKDWVVYFYNTNAETKTYTYNLATDSFTENSCAYQGGMPVDNGRVTIINDNGWFGVNGSKNTLFLFNPNRLDQCKTIDISQHGYETGEDNVYYTYKINNECYMLATHYMEHKVSKLELDLSWETAEPHGHTYTSTITTPATCEADGVETYYCTCGESYTKTLEKLEHIDMNNDGKCDACGVKMTGGDHCKYCGQIHGGPFGWLVKFFHGILAFFKR